MPSVTKMVTKKGTLSGAQKRKSLNNGPDKQKKPKVDSENKPDEKPNLKDMKRASNTTATEKKTPRVVEKIEIKGKDLEIFNARKTELSSRSVFVQTKRNGLKKAKAFIDIALAVNRGKFGKNVFIFGSKEEALKKCKELNNLRNVQATHPALFAYNSTVDHVDPNALKIQNLPKAATKEDVEKAFPNATKVIGLEWKSPCLVYENKDKALQDFRNTSKEVLGKKLILTFAITDNEDTKKNDVEEVGDKVKAEVEVDGQGEDEGNGEVGEGEVEDEVEDEDEEEGEEEGEEEEGEEGDEEGEEEEEVGDEEEDDNDDDDDDDDEDDD